MASQRPDLFSDMLRTALGIRLHPASEGFVSMFAEDGVFEFPYAPPGWPQRVEGRAAIQRYLQGLAGLTLQHVCSPTVRWVENESTVILEFSVKGRNDKTGAPYAQRYISVIELKGGLIALYRDYWNPLPVLEALGSAYSEGGLP